MEEIFYNKEGREKLINGVNKLHDAVASTMGPKGRTVIIPDKDTYGKYKVTKDGVSVAREIKFKDPVENIGAELIKQVAEKTVSDAGDGTTTATVLATAFVNNLKDFEYTEVTKAFDEIIPKVLIELQNNSRKLKQEDIKHVASISANNDVHIGETIQKAFDHSEIVKIEESNNIEDKIELIEGMSLNVSYFSKYFINNEKKGTCELDKPYVLLLDGKLEKLENFRIPLELGAEPGNSLLIITEHIHEQALRKLETIVISNGLKLCVMKTPGFGPHRKDLIRDLSDFTGAVVINDTTKEYNEKVLGRLKSATIGKNSSILIKDDGIELEDLIITLKEYSKSTELTDYDKELLKQRIDNLTGKVSIIKVGGQTENEMKERYDRYDDAVKAVACALEEGIVSGGGTILRHCCYQLTPYVFEKYGKDEKVRFKILESLLLPYQTIVLNGSGPKLNDFLFNENIIDPLKVTRCALENAVSVAKTILSTDAIVLNENEWNRN